MKPKEGGVFVAMSQKLIISQHQNRNTWGRNNKAEYCNASDVMHMAPSCYAVSLTSINRIVERRHKEFHSYTKMYVTHDASFHISFE